MEELFLAKCLSMAKSKIGVKFLSAEMKHFSDRFLTRKREGDRIRDFLLDFADVRKMPGLEVCVYVCKFMDRLSLLQSWFVLATAK